MQLAWIRRCCLALPGATEQVQWGSDLVFKVGGKMFAVAPTEPAPVVLSFKCSDEDFAELTERPGVIPAPYLARAKWVALEHDEALEGRETEALLRKSYDLVTATLPKKSRLELAAVPQAKRSTKRTASSQTKRGQRRSAKRTR